MPRGCCLHFWKRIPKDEPVFTIVAHDKLGVRVIQHWIDLAKKAGVNQFKIDVAKAHADDFKRFADANPGLMKLPD